MPLPLGACQAPLLPAAVCRGEAGALLWGTPWLASCKRVDEGGRRAAPGLGVEVSSEVSVMGRQRGWDPCLFVSCRWLTLPRQEHQTSGERV